MKCATPCFLLKYSHDPMCANEVSCPYTGRVFMNCAPTCFAVWGAYLTLTAALHSHHTLTAATNGYEPSHPDTTEDERSHTYMPVGNSSENVCLHIGRISPSYHRPPAGTADMVIESYSLTSFTNNGVHLPVMFLESWYAC